VLPCATVPPRHKNVELIQINGPEGRKVRVSTYRRTRTGDILSLCFFSFPSTFPLWGTLPIFSPSFLFFPSLILFIFILFVFFDLTLLSLFLFFPILIYYSYYIFFFLVPCLSHSLSSIAASARLQTNE